MVRRTLIKIQATTRLDYLWPEIWIGISKAAKQKEEEEWAGEKPKIDNGSKTEASVLSIL